jgi:DMSO/TMAO reductase YedYZ molybdopterin-dependent catalytic subunit
MTSPHDRTSRRTFVRTAAAGAVVAVLGGLYVFSDELTRKAAAQTRSDGKPRLPPGQRVIERLKPMGGVPGNPDPSQLTFEVSGEVNKPVKLSFKELLALPIVELTVDVHCVTGWSLLDAKFKGVRLSEVAKLAGVKDSARHAIFEAAAGYTANVLRSEALASNVLLAFEHNGQPLGRAHGAPLRAIVPDLYFWKSAKWVQGVKFTARDEPGYWEQRGYHNHADPWREERYG